MSGNKFDYIYWLKDKKWEGDWRICKIDLSKGIGKLIAEKHDWGESSGEWVFSKTERWFKLCDKQLAKIAWRAWPH